MFKICGTTIPVIQDIKFTIELTRLIIIVTDSPLTSTTFFKCLVCVI